MDKTIYTTDQVVLSDLLRQLRERAGLRQSDVAERLGEPQSFVSKYESGERRLDVLELRQVCLALGVPLSRLVATLETRLSAGADVYDERAARVEAEPAGPQEEGAGPAVDEPA